MTAYYAGVVFGAVLGIVIAFGGIFLYQFIGSWFRLPRIPEPVEVDESWKSLASQIQGRVR